MRPQILAVTAALAASVGGGVIAQAGSIVLTGHDPDFHAIEGGNAAGAQHINQRAISFIMDPSANTFAAAGHTKFLYVESSISPPAGHVKGVNGIVASGYSLGTNFDVADASTLSSALDKLGSVYGGLVVASDFGATLTQAELNILDARSSDIIHFLNAGGGLYAMAESNSGAGLTPKGGLFGYLPFVVSSTQLNQSEVGNKVTAFGSSLGLSNTDVNGNASHNVFNGAFGLNVVDTDAAGNILTLAGRGVVNPGGVETPPQGSTPPGSTPEAPVPEPASLLLIPVALVGMGLRKRWLA